MAEDPQQAVKPNKEVRTISGPKADMDEEAIKSANGTLYPKRVTKVMRSVEAGTFHTVFGSSYSFSNSGGFTGGYSPYGTHNSSSGSGQTRGSNFSREVPDMVKKPVEVEVPVKIVYPSPASASHAQVLETFFADNLYKGKVPLRPNEKTLPFLAVSAKRSYDSAVNNPSVATTGEGSRSRVGVVYDMLSEAEKIYKERTAKGEDKDKVALDVIKMLYESKEGSPVFESGAPSAGSLVGLAQGSGKIHHFEETTFDGSSAQLFNYFMAVKRNESKYVGGGQTYSDFFAKAPEGDYAPSLADRIAPSSIATLSQQSADTKAKLAAALNADLKAIDGLRPRNISGSGFLSPSVMSGALLAMKKDAEDGMIGNNPELYRGHKAMAIQLSSLIEMGDHYLGSRQPSGEEAASMAAVVKADPPNVAPDKRVVRTPLTKDLAHDIEVAAKFMTTAKLFTHVAEPSDTATGLPESMKPKTVEAESLKVKKR